MLRAAEMGSFRVKAWVRLMLGVDIVAFALAAADGVGLSGCECEERDDWWGIERERERWR